MYAICLDQYSLPNKGEDKCKSLYMYTVLIIACFCVGHRLWEQKNDWTRSWECRKRKMYNKNRPLVNRKRSICFNGTGIISLKRSRRIEMWYTYTKIKQVCNFVREVASNYMYSTLFVKEQKLILVFLMGLDILDIPKISCVYLYNYTWWLHVIVVINSS